MFLLLLNEINFPARGHNAAAGRHAELTRGNQKRVRRKNQVAGLRIGRTGQDAGEQDRGLRGVAARPPVGAPVDDQAERDDRHAPGQTQREAPTAHEAQC